MLTQNIQLRQFNSMVQTARATIGQLHLRQKQLTLGGGLTAVVYPDRLVFIWRSKNRNVKTSYEKIGTWPEISLRQAQDRAAQLRGDAQEEQEKFEKIPTLGEFFPLFLDAYKQNGGKNQKRWANFRSVWTRLKKMSAYKLDEIRPKNIIKELEGIPVSQNYKNAIFQCLKQCLDYAVLTDVIEINPAAALAASTLNPFKRITTPGVHWIPAKKLKKEFFEPLSEIPEVFKAAILFTVFACTRISETRYMRWEYIDQRKKVILLPAELTKMSRPLAIALTEPLKIFLDHWRSLLFSEYESPLLFPSSRREEEPCSYTTLSTLIRGATGGKCSIHGLRKTASTWMHEQGFGETAERCLGHKVGSTIENIYSYAEYLKDKQKCLGAWHEYLIRECLPERFLELAGLK